MLNQVIHIKLTRQEQSDVIQYFFPYIRLHGQTALKSLSYLERMSREYMGAVLLNCLFDELDRYMQKRLLEISGPEIKNKFSKPWAITLLTVLMALPIKETEFYLVTLRQKLITIISRHITL